jgi:hypothetical protein
MKKQLRYLSYIIVFSLSFGTMAPLTAATITEEKKSLFKAVTEFRQLYDKCRKKHCTPEQEAKLRSQIITIAGIVGGIVVLIGGTLFGIGLLRRHQRLQKQKEIARIIAEQQQEEQEKLLRQQEHERMAFEQQKKSEQERQEMLRRQEEARQKLEQK